MGVTLRHSPLAHAVSVDFLRLLLEDAVSELRGTPILKARAGRGFWYDNYRAGRAVRSGYLGPDTPEMRARLAPIESLRREPRSLKVYTSGQ